MRAVVGLCWECRVVGDYHTVFYIFLKDFIYFLKREEGKEKERERNINVWLPLAFPSWGPGSQSRHVP